MNMLVIYVNVRDYFSKPLAWIIFITARQLYNCYRNIGNC